MSTFSRHPILVLGFGVILGYHVRKYRKEIIEAASGDDTSALPASGTLADILSGIKQGARDAARR